MGDEDANKNVQKDQPTEGDRHLAQDNTINNNDNAMVQNLVTDMNNENTGGIPQNTGKEDTSVEKRKRRREAWEKTKDAGRRSDLHRGLGNILRRAEDLFVEVRCPISVVLLPCC